MVIHFVDVLGYVTSIIAIAGAITNARGKVIGFWLWLLSNMLWIIYAILIHAYAQIPMFAVYTLTTMYGINQWNNKDLKI